MEGQPKWSTEVSIRATRDAIEPYVEMIEALGPEVTADVEGPSEIGVCLVTVNGPLDRSDDVERVFAAFDADNPGSILMDFRD